MEVRDGRMSFAKMEEARVCLTCRRDLLPGTVNWRGGQGKNVIDM